jgi:hypothetical protein
MLMEFHVSILAWEILAQILIQTNPRKFLKIKKRKNKMDTLPIENYWNDEGRDIFCSNCLTHEMHFTGGHSWTPDLCPCGCQDVIVWKNMNIFQRERAQIIYNKNERGE